jgi:hypothetical protein
MHPLCVSSTARRRRAGTGASPWAWRARLAHLVMPVAPLLVYTSAHPNLCCYEPQTCFGFFKSSDGFFSEEGGEMEGWKRKGGDELRGFLPSFPERGRDTRSVASVARVSGGRRAGGAGVRGFLACAIPGEQARCGAATALVLSAAGLSVCGRRRQGSGSRRAGLARARGSRAEQGSGWRRRRGLLARA